MRARTGCEVSSKVTLLTDSLPLKVPVRVPLKVPFWVHFRGSIIVRQGKDFGLEDLGGRVQHWGVSRV